MWVVVVAAAVVGTYSDTHKEVVGKVFIPPTTLPPPMGLCKEIAIIFSPLRKAQRKTDHVVHPFVVATFAAVEHLPVSVKVAWRLHVQSSNRHMVNVQCVQNQRTTHTAVVAAAHARRGMGTPYPV